MNPIFGDDWCIFLLFNGAWGCQRTLEIEILGMFPLTLCANPAVIVLLEQPLYQNSAFMKMACLEGMALILLLEIQEKLRCWEAVKAEVHSLYCVYPIPASCILLKGQLTNVEKVTGLKENKLLMFSKATLYVFSVIKNTPCSSQSVLC